MRAELARSIIGSTVAIGLIASPPASSQQLPTADSDAAETPLDVGLEEQVDVQLVLVDFLAVDRDGVTVPDIESDELLLLVDGKPVGIASLDRDCPAGATAEPRPGTDRPDEPPAPTAQPRRIVIVFDYYHMTNTAETYDAVSDMLDRWAGGEELHMLVSLGEVVRIESPFTRDPEEIRWAMQRMRDDPDLYGGNYGRITERRFYERIQVLFDLLESVPGRKTVVLFSGPFIPDGFFYDPLYKHLSGLATTTRTAIYPVDTTGLGTAPGLGGPPPLRRLANETGGRMTSDTNDIGLAYARAHRDLGCTYTLGFYDQRPRLDKERRVSIRVDRRGLRIRYPEFYVVRSREEKAESLKRTAAMAPHMFESDEVQADLFVLGPASRDRWRTLFAIEIDEIGEVGEIEGAGRPTTPAGPRTLQVKGLLRKANGTVVRKFEREVSVPGGEASTGSTLTVLHELKAPPGRYVASAVVTTEDGRPPRARTRPVELSRVPLGGPFLIGPILGRQPPPSDETHGDEPPAQGFEPLVVAEAVQGQPLDSLTVVCVAGADEPVDMRTIAREVLAIDGTASRRLGSSSARFEGKGRVQCHQVLDRLETAGLAPGRYEISAHTETSTFLTGTGSTEFTIRPASAE